MQSNTNETQYLLPQLLGDKFNMPNKAKLTKEEEISEKMARTFFTFTSWDQVIKYIEKNIWKNSTK